MVRSMERWVGKVAVVTGAASGIGAGIVDQLIKEGVIVAGLDLNAERIEERAKTLKKGQLYGFKVNLIEEEEVKNTFKLITENLGPVHILVNCAGYYKMSSVLDEDSEIMKKVFGTNVFGSNYATKQAIKSMKTNNIKGHIININSVLGHNVTTYKYGVFPGSKYAVTALTEVLRQELDEHKLRIKVTSVSPGLVETGLTTFNPELTPEWKALFDGREMLKPEDIADGVLYALSTPEHVQVREVTITPFSQK